MKGKVLVCFALALGACATPQTGQVVPTTTAVASTVPRTTSVSATSVSATSVPAPVETTATTVDWASVALDQEALPESARPTALLIENIGVDAPVVSLGVTSSGEMAVPEDIGAVGWYHFGPAPGEVGSAVLAAHVDKAGEGPGVFFHLDRVKVDDRLTVRMSDGTSPTFRVVSTERVAKTDLGVDTLFASDGAPVIRLITCGGDFDRIAGSYVDNIVVTAVPEAP